MIQGLGKYVIICGLMLVVLGVIFHFWGDKLSSLGSLPGDIKVEKEKYRFYFPVTSMILLSILISVVFWIFRKLF